MGDMGILSSYAQSHILCTEGGRTTVLRASGCLACGCSGLRVEGFFLGMEEWSLGLA